MCIRDRANIRFKLDPRTREDRAEDARQFGLSGYETPMRDFLEAVLKAYEREGVEELGYDKLGDLLKIRYGSLSDAKTQLGDIPKIRTAFVGLQRVMYAG